MGCSLEASHDQRSAESLLVLVREENRWEATRRIELNRANIVHAGIFLLVQTETMHIFSQSTSIPSLDSAHTI